MTLDDIELYKLDFSENFARFRRFEATTAKRMNVSDDIVAR